jgi:shikimate dehydrogenase
MSSAPPTLASATRDQSAPAMSVVSGTTTLYAHLGDPIDVVKSPFIYNPWFRTRGIDAAVIPMGLRAADFPPAVATFRAITNLHGLIITMPHKIAIVPLLDSRSDAVQAAGSCNAVVKRPDGTLHGELFDGLGFVAGLDRKGFVVRGTRCLVVGAGGVGSAIAAALAANGAAEIVVHDVSEAAAASLARRLSAHYPATRTVVGSNDAAGHDVVVNASPLGMNDGDPLPVDVANLSPGAFVGEVVMKRAMTPLLKIAASRGCPYQPGLDMLYEQIPLYLEFFGHGRPSPDELRAIG